MDCKITRAIDFKHEPVAVVLTDQKPEKAKQFKPGKWGCVMFMLAAACKGETAVFDRETFGCHGGGTGLGFGNQYKNFPGGEDCFSYFLSVGNSQWETGRQMEETVKQFLRPETLDHFIHGERYIQSPELVKDFISGLPITDIEFKYVVFKPLKEIRPGQETPAIVIFLGNMDQISALSILANYHRKTNDNVIFPYCAGCMSIVLYPLSEAGSDRPKAVLGLNDISARVYLKRLLKDNVMSFAVPFKLFCEMEENVAESFLERGPWMELVEMGETKKDK
ncbi:MAG: DUF169 domain-containing protein [Desulfobacteraceae bacterium]|nr:DUF169 domain-containing protein [Desulfobacteraceae bacterium]MBC2757618.1 DUF169 domain-containing protein [Desulfobacteraceae bacterium]